MSTLPESNNWVPGIRQLETTDIAQAGAGGLMNLQASQLADRTVHLKAAAEALAGAQDALADEVAAVHAAADTAQSTADLAVTAASNAQTTANAGVSAAAAAQAKADTAQSGVDSLGQLAVLKDSTGSAGAARLPSGTTAQRPAGPANGMVRYNGTLGEYERYQGGAWVPFNGADKAINEAPVVTLTAAATVNIGAAASNTIKIIGTTAITSFGTIASGALRRIFFDAPLVLTHSSSLILPGSSNIATARDDVAEFVSMGSGVWRCVSYQRAEGRALNLADALGETRQWQSMTTSRALGISYMNTSGRQIEIRVSCSNRASQDTRLYVDGVEVQRVAGGSASGTPANVGATIPPQATYRVDSNADLLVWAELR